MNVDTVAPTVEISGLSGTSGAVTVTITFSEDVTGFTVGDIAVSNGVASDFAGSGATYTARITPTDGGMVTSLVIAAGVAVDAANNGNKRATANNATVSRLAAPAPLTATPGDGQVTLGWTVTADNAGFAAATRYRYRYLGRGVTPEWRDVPDNDGDGDLSDETSHVVAGLTNDVNYLFQVLAVNAAGLGSPASITAMPSATVDSTAPTVISIKRQTPSTSPTNADSLTWRVTFSEAVMGVDGADFTITGSTASATAADSSASTVWDVTASGGDLETLDGTVTLGFASGQHIDDAIVDASGNPLDATLPAGAETTYTVDNTPDRPTGADRTVTTEEDTAYAFTAGDFGFVDADEGDTLAGIRITALETAGALKFSADVTLDQVISKSQIDTGLLTFTPAANANGPGYATFGFKVSDGTLESAAANTITIDVTAVNDAPTGLPAIAGIAGVPSEGDTLTAATDAIADADGLGTFGYQWKRDGTAIAGATSSTYTLAQADVGSAITVTVSWTDDGGTAESVTSAPTEMVTPAPLTVTITTGLEVRETAGPVTATITFSAAVTGFAETDLAVVFGTLSEFTEVTSGTVWTVVLTPNPNFNGQSVSLTVPAGVAVDANGNGNKRAETSVRYLAPLKAPATFTLTPGDTQLTLAWTAPANDGKGLAALIKYQYQYHRSGAPWVWWKDVPDSDGDKDLSDETGLVLTGLDNGQRYRFQLRALNGAGVGVSTAIISAVPSASAANAAPAFASDTLTRSVAENSASGTNVGAAIPAATDTDNDSLTYTMEGTDAASFAFDASTRQITTTSGVDYDHETKSSYSVTVKADDGNGGTDTVAVTITVSDVNEPPAAPGAPTVSATAGSTTGLDVAWTAPSNTGKPAISSYDLRYRAGSSGDWTNGPQDVATTSSALTGLTAGTSYQVQVRATNAEGDSGWSAAGSGTTNSPANTAPVFADTTLTRSVAENSASGTNVGAAVPAATDTDNDSLTYTMEGTDAASFAFDASTRQITTTSGVDYDHETKSSYSVTVKADDGNGGTDTVAVTITVSDVNEPPAAPGAPTVSATAGSTTGLDVAWTAPSNTGKPAISSYDLRYRAGSSGDWTNGPQDVATTSSALTGLTAGTSHQVQVRATNAEGDSGWSASGSGTTGTPANRTPVVNNMIPDQTATEGTAFSYAFPSNTFSDPDTGDTLTYTAVLSDDSALPSWLTFTGSTRTFSGTPAAADAGALAVKVTASDGSLSAEDTFTLTVNALPVLSIALPSVEGLSRNMAGQQVYEETGGPGGLTLSFDVSLTPAPSAAQSVCVRVTETGGSRIASTDKGVRTVSVPTTGSTALSLTWTDTAADDADSTITVEAVAPSDTACSQTGYTVSATDGSDEALVVDDDPTTVELTGSDLSMFEGDASDTAVLTVTLGRQLAAGEVVVAPLVLASTTGARLPGSTDGGGDPDNDFTVSVSGTGVTVSGADSANPTLTFTGHDTNTVQTATVTLAPVDSRDDGDSADEAITARLASNSVLSASGTGTNVGGGASRHATNFQVSVTMIDDEGGGIGLSVSEVRLLENGSTTYTVVLDAEPTSLVLMSMTRKGTHDGAATISPTSHSFIVGDGGNWDQPVTITVSGVDESNQNRNRTLELDHDFDSLDSRYDQTTRTLPVKVDDAPEIEAWEGWVWDHGALDPARKMERPRTVTSTPGLSLGQDIVAGPLDYVIRLSNRPETGGTVTVTATVGDSNLAGISLTPNGTPQGSLTLTFKDRDPSPHCNNGLGNDGEDYDNTAESSWKCWRRVYVHDLAAGKTGVLGCTDITHTATGGGVRGMTGPRSWSVGTIRAHMFSQSRRVASVQEFRCPFITGKGSDPGMGSTSNAPLTISGPPTDPVSNLQLAAVDASSAKATWDAVVGATGYRVEWEATDGLNAAAGVRDGVTETAFTIAHNMPAATSLTVKVIPEHVDGEGNPQALDQLAGTATLALGSGPSDSIALQDATPQGPTEAGLEACVPDGLMATAERLYERNRNKPPHYAENWFSVLMAFGQRTPAQWTADDRLLTPMSAASARQRGWKRFGDALECLEAYSPPAEVPSTEGGGVPLPSVRIAAGAAVTEGAASSFTLEVGPAPASDLAVTVEVAETGAVLAAAALGERTVTIPAGKTEAAFTVATAADETDEPAGAVTATVVRQDGYAVDKENGGASATVAVEDDDATAVALSAPAGDVPEAGGGKTLTVTLGRSLVEGERLTAPLLFGGAATLGSDYTLSAPETAPQGVSYADLASTDKTNPPALTFTGPSAASATVILTATADSAAEGESETVTVGLGTLAATGLGGGAEGTGTVGFAILEPPPEVSIAAKTASITEGADAMFTVTASRAPGSDLIVRLEVSESDGSDFVAADNEGAATVTIPKGQTEAAFTVATVDDTADEPDGTVTATLAGDTGDGGDMPRYTVAASPGDAASVAVGDDDAAQALPMFSIGDETVNEQDGFAWFTVRLSKAAGRPVSVSYRTRHSTPVSARQDVDYMKAAWHLDFGPEDTEKRFWVYVFNDGHNEAPETFEVALSRPSAGAGISDGVAVGTIVNDDPMPAAWLSRFGRTAAEQALDAVSGRMAADRTPGTAAAFAGRTLDFGAGARAGEPEPAPAGHGALLGDGANEASHGIPGSHDGTGMDGIRWRTVTLREALTGSNFTATGPRDGAGGSLAFWGRAAEGGFDGREGAFSLDGEATTALLGADYGRGGWLAGLALMQSAGEGGYADTGIDPRLPSQTCPRGVDGNLCGGAVREGDGGVEATLTALVPYASMQAAEATRIWGALGYGAGEVTLDPEMGDSLAADLSWTMAFLGFSRELLALPEGAGGLKLSARSDALWARTASDGTRELAASESDVTRLRLGLEGSWRMELEKGRLTPRLELGIRHDGGDAETGTGVEAGGGLSWTDPGLGLELEITGRTLVSHEDDDLEDRGFSASVAYDPDPSSGLGPSLQLRQETGGRSKGGLDALFAPTLLEDRDTGGGTVGTWSMEAAWGLPVLGGRFTGSPHLGFGHSANSREWTLGWRVAPESSGARDVSFGLKAVRRESRGEAPRHAAGFEMSVRW